MNITTASEASAFKLSQVADAVNSAVAVKTADTEKQHDSGVLLLLSAAAAVVDAAIAPAAPHAVDVVV